MPEGAVFLRRDGGLFRRQEAVNLQGQADILVCHRIAQFLFEYFLNQPETVTDGVVMDEQGGGRRMRSGGRPAAGFRRIPLIRLNFLDYSGGADT